MRLLTIPDISNAQYRDYMYLYDFQWFWKCPGENNPDPLLGRGSVGIKYRKGMAEYGTYRLVPEVSFEDMANVAFMHAYTITHGLAWRHYHPVWARILDIPAWFKGLRWRLRYQWNRLLGREECY